MEWLEIVKEPGTYLVHYLEPKNKELEYRVLEITFGEYDGCSWLQEKWYSADRPYTDTVHTCHFAEYFSKRRFIKLAEIGNTK